MAPRGECRQLRAQFFLKSFTRPASASIALLAANAKFLWPHFGTVVPRNVMSVALGKKEVVKSTCPIITGRSVGGVTRPPRAVKVNSKQFGDDIWGGCKTRKGEKQRRRRQSVASVHRKEETSSETRDCVGRESIFQWNPVDGFLTAPL